MTPTNWIYATPAIVDAFNAEFKGKYHHVFLNTLDRYYAGSHVQPVYNHSIAFVQSSCTGKSRITDEAAKDRMSFLFNIREELDGWSESGLFETNWTAMLTLL